MSRLSDYVRCLGACGFRLITSIFLAASILVPCMAYSAIKVDGRIDEPDWEGAQIFSKFVVTDPLTLEDPRHPTRALLLSTPEGLAVAFICEQPLDETRARTVARRDATKFDADSVSFMVDFDGNGEIAYEFSVSIAGSYRDGNVVNEVRTNYDWDGLWQRAVNEEPERWTVEMLIPWAMVAMREEKGDTRRIGVCFQRRLNSSNETFAFPDASVNRSRFLSDFAKVEVKSYSAQEFYIVPYVTVLRDQIESSVTGKVGMDIFWKKSGKFQLAATINPDFGQVESDDLVINFTAIETLFSDKRPFFTENQGIFEGIMPMGNSVFYTRRIGRPNDKDGGPSDIEAALKIIGSVGSVNYGGFAAREAEEEGRSFYAARVVLPVKNWTLGALSTYVERPYLDRTALVNSFDYRFRLEDILRVQGIFMGSEIKSKEMKSRGSGTFNVLEFSPNDQWSGTANYLRYGDTLDISDMGYLQRNNYEEYFFKLAYRRIDFPEDSHAVSVTYAMTVKLPQNLDGVRLPRAIAVNRSEKMRNGDNLNISLQMTERGYDDLISRGNGLVWLNKRWSLNASYRTQRRGAWGKSLRLSIFQEGYEDWAAGVEGSITWYPHETFNINFRLYPQWSDDWLIWMRGDQLGSFSRRQVTAGITSNWFPAEGHEVLLRCQWITLNADSAQAYRIGSDSRLVPTSDPLNNFARINFAMQLRYRYEIAPMSDLYVVYSRGGLENIDSPTKSTTGLLAESTSLRGSDQFLIKLRYRF